MLSKCLIRCPTLDSRIRGEEGLCNSRKGVDLETTEMIVLGKFDDVAVDPLQRRKR